MAKYRFTIKDSDTLETKNVAEFEGPITFRLEYNTNSEQGRHPSIILEELIYNTDTEKKEDLVISDVEKFINQNFVNFDQVLCDIYSDGLKDYYNIADIPVVYYSYQTLLQENMPENALVQYRLSLLGG